MRYKERAVLLCVLLLAGFCVLFVFDPGMVRLGGAGVKGVVIGAAEAVVQ